MVAVKIGLQAPWLEPSRCTLTRRKSCTLLKSHREVNPPSPVSCLLVITCCISDPDQNGGVWVAIFPRYLTLFFFSYFGRSACEHNIQHIFFMSLTIITTTSPSRRCVAIILTRRWTTRQERQTKTTIKQWTGERGMEEDDGGSDK